MKRKYFILFGFSLFFLLVSSTLAQYSQSFFVSLLGDLAAGFVGATLTTIFIEKKIEDQARQEMQRVKLVALRKLHYTVVTHIKTFYFVNNKYMWARVGEPPKTIREIFSDEFFVVEKLLLILSSGNIEIGPEYQDNPEAITRLKGMHDFFRSMVKQDLEKFFVELEQILDLYARYLSAPLIEVISQYANQKSLIVALELAECKELAALEAVPESNPIVFEADELKQKMFEDFSRNVESHIDSILAFVEYLKEEQELEISVDDVIT